MEKAIYLSIIIPAYNEGELIEKTLLEIDSFFCKQKYSYEIIVVDDGSKDSTFFIADNLKKRIKYLDVIKNEKNFGKGYSVKRGMLLAKGEKRLFIDADNSTSIDQINSFFPFFDDGYDLVIGNRKLKESKIIKHQQAYKEIFGSAGNMLVKLLAVSKISDTQCGFKLFSAKFVENIFPKLTINHWGFDMEILALANKFGYKIKTVPVVWSNRKKSNVFLKDYFFTFAELVKIKINLIKKHYDKK